MDGGYLLPIEIDPAVIDKISDKDEIEIDLDTNTVTNTTSMEKFNIKPFPEIISKIVKAGGLLYYKD